MTTSLEVHRSLDALSPEWDPLFEAAPDAQSSRAWFAASADAALPAGAEPLLVAIRADGVPAALVPMQAGPGRRFRSLTTPYTCLFQPLLTPDASPALITTAAAAFGRAARRRPVTMLEALEADWPGLRPFCAGLRAAGLVTRSFAHFGNWHEQVPGTWAAYLDARPGQMRATILRKTRAAERDPALRLEVVRTPDALAGALDAYEAVYARSWKEKEPYPDFNRALLTRLGPSGLLRFGLMWAGERPIAAQYWTVFRGRATVLKLAHDDAFKSASPGTVLSAYTIRHLIEVDRVVAIDFGRGDDAYKAGWATARRQRLGLLAFNPTSGGGLAGLIRHDAGRMFRVAQLS